MSGLAILGTGRCLPGRCVTNQELSRVVDTSDEWITARTGIRQRYLSTPEESLTDQAAQAARLAMERAGVTPDQIGLVVAGTFTPDHASPSLACEVHGALGLATTTPAFDVNAACSGFLTALETARCFLEGASCGGPCALVIGAEQLSRVMNMEDRSTCVLFGDGAGAAVLQAAETGVIDMTMGSDGTKGSALACTSRTLGNFLTGTKPELGFMTMYGQEVFSFAVRKIPESVKYLLEKTGTSREEIKYYVLHQANERIVEAAARRLKEPMSKFPMTIGKYGNTSTASIPLLLDDMVRQDMLKPGDKILLSGFGAGMTWGAVLMEWTLGA